MKQAITLLALGLMLLGLVGCKGQKNPGPMETIEEAEEWFEAAGFELEGKKENKDVIFGERAFNYQVGEVGVLVLQFPTEEAADKWKEFIDNMPMGKMQAVVKGKIGIGLSGGDDSDRQKILKQLKG